MKYNNISIYLQNNGENESRDTEGLPREKRRPREKKFLANERKRRMKYYVPSQQLNKKEREIRNKKNRENVKRHRLKKKAEILALAE